MADSKELQNQLQINEQINKVLAARSAQMQQMQKQLSSQTQMALELCKALDCEDVDGIRERVESLNAAMQDAADKAGEMGSAQQKAGQEAAEGLEGAREKSGGLLDSLSSVKAGAIAGGAGFMKAFSGVGGLMKMVGGGIMGVVGNLASVGKSILAIPFQMFSGLVGMATAGGGGTDALREAMNDLKEEMGDLATGAGAAVMESFDNLKSSSGALAQSGLSMGKVFGYGREGMAGMLKAVGEIAKEAGASLDMITDQLAEAGDAAVMMNKGLGMSNKALAEMMRQAKNSGTSARDEMIEMGSMAIQMGDKFGVSAKSIGKNVSTLIEDVENFGNMSKKQLTATATYMAKLGLEAKDLQGVISKFDDFESAAEGVSQLNQAFGIQLDTMEMMNAQNPAERIDMMRDAFHQAGKSVEDMTRAEKKLMAEQMGLSVSAMENALATENMGVSYEDMEEAAEESEANKMSEKEVMLELSKSIKQLSQSGSSDIGGFFDAFKKGFSKGFAQAKGFKDLMRAIRQSLKIVFKFGKKLGKMVGDLFDQLGLFKSLKKIFDPEVFGKFFKKAEGYFKKFFDAVTGKGDYSAAQLLQDLTNEFMGTFGKAGGEAASGLAKFFESMIDIAGEVLASALPWLVEKLAGMIQGIADFLADPAPAMNAAKGATEGIGGAFAKAFSKIGKALKPVLPKLGKAFKDLFTQLFILIKPFLIKAFIALIAISAAKGIAVGLIKGAGTAAIMGAIKFLAKKMGMTMAASTGKEMKKGAGKGMKKGGGFFKSLGAQIKAVAKISPASVLKAGAILVLLSVLFGVGMVLFAGAVFIAAKILSKVPFKDVAKVLLVTIVSLAAVYALVLMAMALQPPVVLSAIPALLAAAALFTIGMVAFAIGARLAYEILKPVSFIEFAGIMGIMAMALMATIAFTVIGAAFAAVATPPVLGMIAVGLLAAAALFTVGMVAFGLAIVLSMKVLNKVAGKAEPLEGAIDAIITIIKAIGLMAGLGAIFAAIGIFVVPLLVGFGIAAGFFLSLMPLVQKMVGALNKIPITDPKKTGQKIEIIAKLGAAMQAIAKVGLDAGKMALAAEKMKPGGMEIMFKNITDLISKVSDTLITLIGMIVVLGANLTPGQAKNVEILAGAIGSIATLAGALMSPLEAVSKMSSGMFGPSVQEVMGAVADGLVLIMDKIETSLPSLIDKIVNIAKGIKEDPKTLQPKMDIVTGALSAVGNFAKAIEAVAELMPPEGGGFFKKGKSMEQRIADMTSIISGVVKAVKADMEKLVKAILDISIPNPEAALKRVQVIDKAMSATSSFATMVEKLVAADVGDNSAAFSHIAKGIYNMLDPGYSSYNVNDIFNALALFEPDESALAKFPIAQKALDGVVAFSQSVAAAGSVIDKMGVPMGDVVMAMVDEAEYALNALNSIGDLNAEVALQNFAHAIGTGSGEFTITNEPININMNVQVTMDAGRVARVLTDKPTMTAANGPTLATAE